MRNRIQHFLWCLLVALCLLLVVVIGNSCVSEKKRLEICKSCTLNQVTKDSIIVLEKLQRDTIYTESPCDTNGKLKPNFVQETLTKGGSIKVSTKGNKLIVQTENKLKETTHLKATVSEVPARCEKTHLTKWDSFFINMGKIFLWILIGVVMYLFIRWRLQK